MVLPAIAKLLNGFSSQTLLFLKCVFQRLADFRSWCFRGWVSLGALVDLIVVFVSAANRLCRLALGRIVAVEVSAQGLEQ